MTRMFHKASVKEVTRKEAIKVIRKAQLLRSEIRI